MISLTIPSGDTRLESYLHQAPSGQGTPLLVVCHGFCGSVDGGSSPELAETLQQYDISLLRFRFTPQRCLSQQIFEIGTVVEYCRNNVSRSIALMGRSMGAAAALAFAAVSPALAGLCLMAPPADLSSTFRGILGEDYDRLERGQAVTVFHEGEPVHLTPEFIQDFGRHDLLHAARNLAGIPLMLVHGLEDPTVPVEQGRQLFCAAGAPKQLLLLPGHGHSFSGCAQRFVPSVAEWLLREVFPSRP